MLTKYKKTIKRVFCVPAAIVGVGVFGVAVGGMAVLGGIGTVCYIAESIIETTVDTLFDITSLIYNLSINNEIPVAAIELDECPMVESKVLEIYDTDTDTSLEGGGCSLREQKFPDYTPDRQGRSNILPIAFPTNKRQIVPL